MRNHAMEISSRTVLTALIVVMLVIIGVFVLRSCKEINIKQKNTDQKTVFSVEVEKNKEKNKQE